MFISNAEVIHVPADLVLLVMLWDGVLNIMPAHMCTCVALCLCVNFVDNKSFAMQNFVSHHSPVSETHKAEEFLWMQYTDISFEP